MSASAIGGALLQLLGLLLSAPALDDKHESKAPSATTKGEIFEWKSANGIPFEYYVPKSYDAKAGANLVVVLHGNGLDYRWTFFNHPAGEFRPDDVVVSLEGPVFFESTKAFEFGAGRDNCLKVREVLQELKKAWNVRATFLYGHSQGSFFVYEFAGEFPDDVQGVVGHAGALWNSSKLAKAGHHQAIAFLHGTDDANVPWHQSASGREAYREAGYPRVHLRTMWDWPHAPNWMQAQNELAWCEGMTSADPARVASALETLSDENARGGVDFAALFAVAARLETLAGATAAQKAAATKAKSAVDKVAKSVAAAIDASLGGEAGKSKLTKVDGKPWLGMTLRFVEDFDGVAACAAWTKAHAQELAAIDKEALASGRAFWQDADKEPAKAFAAGVDLLEKGWRNASANDVAARMEAMLADEKALKLGKKESARARAVVDGWKKGSKDGVESYARLVKGLDL